MQTQSLPPQAVLFDMAWGHFRARLLETFTTLGVPDAIAAGRDPGVNERFLRACASMGLLERTPAGYKLTEVGNVLRADVPDSMRSLALAFLAPSSGMYRAWENLAFSAKTEGDAFVHTMGEHIWDYYTKTNPEEGRQFNQLMQGLSAGVLGAILERYALPESGIVVDVGGGVGTMLCAFLNKQPGLRGIVVDMEATRAGAEEYIASQGLQDRCAFQSGNFFEAVPAGGDLYTMKWILHDWNDERAAAILRTVHAAMPAHAKLALFEAVVPEDDSIANSARMMDMNMMVVCGGKERSEEDWRALLDANGFRLDRIVPTPTPNFVIEASKK
jgi:hypothetical protein